MKSFLLSTFFLLITIFVNAQVGIGTAAPDNSSMLEITSTNSGLLIPRVALLATNNNVLPINAPATSLLVYNTSTVPGVNGVSPGYYYWNGIWIPLATGTVTQDWALTGNAGTTAGTNFIGTTDGNDLRIKTGGNDRLNISNTNGQLQSYTTTGSAATPSYSFSGTQTSTGMFNPLDDNLGFSSGGSERFRIPNANQVHAMSLGTAALPFYSFSGQTTTGMFGVASDVLGFSTAATERVRIEADGDVGIGATPNASAKLEIRATDRGLLIPNVALTATNAAGPITAPATSLLVYNTATAGVIPNNVVPGFYYWNGAWIPLVAGTPTQDWSLTGNSGTNAATNYIGTNDVQDLVFKTSAVVNTPLERMRITTAGNVGINAAPIANTLLTLNTNTNAIRNGIDLTMTNATSAATGLNITAGAATVNGVTVSNSTTSSSGSVYGIGSVLSATNIVSGFNSYRIDGGGVAANAKSYGLYGISGTNSLYNSTNASTWAGFLQGRTVISSESSPSSPLGTDLEIRNTTTGAAAPATVSLRQTTSLPSAGNVLANLNFGDNYVTTPQAQIQVFRDAAATSSSDMPTAMTFSTTPDAGSTLTERVRIEADGDVGIGTYPTVPNASAKLEIKATDRGLLIPNVALTATNVAGPITAPATSLLVYNTATSGVIPNNVVPGYYFNSGTPGAPIWTPLSTGLSTNNWNILGNTNIVDGTHFIGTGTGNSVDVAFKRNGLAAGKIGATSTSFGLASANLNTAAGTTAFGVSALAANVAAIGNTAVGSSALAANTAGTANTAIGSSALAANTTSVNNTAVGFGSLASQTTAGNNTAIGTNALTLANGSFNTAVGSLAAAAITTAVENTALGYNALNAANTGINNTAVGSLAADALTTGRYNVAVGSNSLGAQTTSDFNVGVGANALLNNVTGANNVAVGTSALSANTASDNTAVGHVALSANTTGIQNTAVGVNALQRKTTGSANTAVGHSALNAAGTFDNVTAVGFEALLSNTASNNTALGFQALRANTTAPGNTAVGSSALAANTATNNTAVGTAALGSNTTSLNNVAVGFNALNTNTTGIGNNTAVGSEALLTNNGGIENTAIGRNALRSSVTTASWNTAVGSNALRFINNAAAQNNVAVGYNAMENSSGNVNQSVAIGSLAARNSLGNNCTSVGFKALGCEGGASTGIDNVAVGNQSLRLNTSGFQNVGIGSYSLELNSSGTNNTAVGHLAGRGNTIGSNNTYVGLQAGSASSGSSNTFVGYQAGNSSAGNSVAIGNLAGSADNTSDKLYISNSATTAITSLIYGDFSGTRILRTNSTFQIGNPAGLGYQFPIARGTVGQVLHTNNVGVLSWVDVSSTETDPQVSSVTSTFVPRWNGTTLVDGVIRDDGTNVGVGGAPSAGNKLDITGNTKTTNFQMTAGSALNTILRSDAAGNATWVAASSVETDPQVSSATNNSIPRWNNATTTLVDGVLVDDATNVGVGMTPLAGNKLDVNGKTRTTSLETSNFQMTTGAALNSILRSDAAGNATWVTASTVETDPQVSSVTSNVVPKWNGTALVDGIVTDDGTNVIVAGNTRTTNLQMTTGANSNYILQSDATGNGTWVDSNVKSFVNTGAAVGTYNVSLTEYTIRVFNSLTTVNLPSAPANPGKIYIIIGSNGIATKNFTSSAGGIYDDVTNTTYTTLNANQRFMVQSDGVNWIVIGS